MRTAKTTKQHEDRYDLLDLIIDRLTQRICVVLTPVINDAMDEVAQRVLETVSESHRYVRTAEVVSEMETSYATLKRWIADGAFPPPVARSPTRKWFRRDLEDIKRLGSWAKVLEERGGAA